MAGGEQKKRRKDSKKISEARWTKEKKKVTRARGKIVC